MKNTLNRLFACLFLIVCMPAASFAGSGWYGKFDNAIRRFLVSGIDTTYIVAAPMSWEIPVVAGIHGSISRISIDRDHAFTINSGNVPEVGIGIGYHGLDYVYKVNLGRNNSFKRYFEFNYYDNYWGAEIITSEKTPSDAGVGVATTSLGGYIALNGKEFSYPASFYGNYIQKRSSGSALIFIWYDHTRAWASPEGSVPALASPVNVDNVAVCGGYGYNWSFNEGKTLLSAVGCAGLIAPYFGVSAQVRLSAMHWHSDSFRTFVSLVQYASLGMVREHESFVNSEWMATVGVAYCFGRKRSE